MWRWLIVLGAAGVAGCGSAPDHAVPRWTLEHEGRASEVTVPVHLDVPDRETTYTLRATVEIPPELRSETPSLVIPYFSANVTLEVDGFPAVSTETDAVLGYRARGPHQWRFPDQVRGRERVTLALTVEHRWLQSGWLDSVPRLVPHGVSDPDLRLVKTFNDYGATFGLFGLLELGALYLAVYLVQRRHKEHLWLAIQALTAMCYPLVISGLSQGLLGTLDIPFLMVFLTTAALASVPFTHEALHLGRPSRAWWLLWALVPFLGVFGLDPFTYQRFAAPATIVTIVIVMVYQLTTCGRLSLLPRERRPVGARYLVVAWMCLGALASFDLLAWLGIVDALHGVRGGGVGLGVFAIAQALLLARQHDELTAALTTRVSQLESRQREIELLNQELRRQMSDRSGLLFEALRNASTATTPAPTLVEGEVIEDRYRVVRILGSGGMGAVYEVVRLADDRHFALKITRQRDAAALARLAREAQIAANVVHPNVVAIVDVDVAATGFLFIVIELVSGKAMNDHTERYRDTSWMLPLLAQVADGLAALHDQGIVHRDLKPANILIDDTQDVPIAKIADFGISRVAATSESTSTPEQVTSLLKPARGSSRKLSGEPSEPTPNSDSPSDQPLQRPSAPSLRDSSSSLTHTGFVAGTPMYMAPELATDVGIVAPSSDIFSFGVVAYLALSGKLPWIEPPVVARLQGTAVVPPRSLIDDVPDLPKPVADVLSRCLALEPSQRPTAAELVAALA